MKIIFCFIDEFEPQDILSIFLIFWPIRASYSYKRYSYKQNVCNFGVPSVPGELTKKSPIRGIYPLLNQQWIPKSKKTWDTFHVPQNLAGKNLQLFGESHFLVPPHLLEKHFLQSMVPVPESLLDARMNLPIDVLISILDFPDVFENKKLN